MAQAQQQQPPEPIISHDSDIEAISLGCVMIDPSDALPELRKYLRAADYFGEYWRYIFRAMCEVEGRGDTPDIFTVTDQLRANGHLEKIGGISTVTALANQVPTSQSAAQYARIILKHAIRRTHFRIAELHATMSQRDDAEAVAMLAKAQGILADQQKRLDGGTPDAEDQRSRFRFLSAEEAEAMPPARGILGDILYEDSIAYLFGPSGRWKSFVALSWAMCISLGRDWLGRPVRQGPVVYIAAEGARGVGKRIRAWRMKHGAKDARPDLHILPMPVDLMDAVAIQALIQEIAERCGNPEMVIFDTLARSMNGDENATRDANVVTTAMSAIKAAFSCCVLAVHHTGKDDARGMRGSSAIFANADTVIRVNGKEGQERLESGETIKLISEKPKENDPFADIYLTTEKVSWSLDDGAPVSSLVIVAGDASAAPQAKPARLSSNSLTALSSLASMPNGAKANEWWHASGIAKTSFMQWAKPDILARGLVCEVDGTFRLTQAGADYLQGNRGSRGNRVVPFRPA